MNSPPADSGQAECHLIENVMAVLGRAWAGAVLQAMLDGAERFTDIARGAPGVTDAVLSARLKELCARGLVTRHVHPGPPVAVTYQLTPAGRDVEPVLTAIRTFGLAHPVIAGPRRERQPRSRNR
ncbi:MAG: helix-turn-helix domain-containing protein [Tetrasphaera sp.]